MSLVAEQKFRSIQRIATALGSTLQLDQLLEMAVCEITSLMDADRSTLYLIDDDKHELWTKVLQGDDLKEFRLPVGSGIAGAVAQSGELVNIADAYQDVRFNPKVDFSSGYVTRSVLCGPLKGKQGGIIGVVQVLNKRGDGAFSAQDEELLVALSAQVSIAVENTQLYESLIKKNEALLQAQEELKQRAREERLATVGQLVSSILHDLRTPMTVISGYAQLMAQTDEAATRATYVEQVLRQFDMMSAMTREVLAFVRGESTLLVRKVYVQRFMQDVAEHVKKELSETGVELQLDLQYTGVAYFDETKIRRVIYNLARNAAQAMSHVDLGRTGQFMISVRAIGDELVMDFSDNGPGIPAALEGRVFEIFATAGKKDGTGLGLAIVDNIVREHGGRISYQSKYDAGTSFRIELPLKPQTMSAAGT